MKVLITGGAGFLGLRLARRLLADGALTGTDGRRAAIDEIVLADVVAGPPLPDARVHAVVGDIADPAFAASLLARQPGAVFHLAAVVSGQAEAELETGMRVNVDGTRNLLDACRVRETVPRFVFASSLAVYGGDLPPVVSEQTPLAPQSSYGTQKAIGELLVNDYSRRGLVDGRVLRLPTIIVRPGRPNRAASTFASSIIREPLQGEDAVCPVAATTTMVVMSPRRVIDSLLIGHDLDSVRLGNSRTLQLPGIAVSVAQMVEALRSVGGEAMVRRIRWEPDARIERIVAGWPRALAAPRAEALGMRADASMAAIVEAFMADDMRRPGEHVTIEAGTLHAHRA
jgi:nucleoside-diphosphate-sugar epimerase